MNIFTLTGAVIAAVLIGLLTLGSSQEGVIKVGVILPLTGDTANLGEPGRNVMQIAVDEVNAAGGISGNQMQLIFEDGACDGKTAASAMQKLVSVDKVQVVIGAGCSGESLAAEPVATAAKVAMLSPFSSTPDLTGKSPYFARNYPSDLFQGIALADVAAGMGLKKIAVIQEQTDFGVAFFKIFDTKIKAFGGTTVKEEFTTDTSDFRAVLTKLRAEKPDGLLLAVQSSPSGQKILKQMAELGWKPQLFLSDAITGDPATLTGFSAQLEGAIGAVFTTDSANSKFAAMIATYKTKHGAEPAYQGYMQTSYDAVYLVRDAVTAVGYDGTKIANWFHTSVKNWQGASGNVSIGADGDPSVGHKPQVIRGGVAVPYTK